MEGFDDHHGATATQWTGLQGDARERLVSISIIPGGGFGSDRGRGHLQELPAQNKILSPIAIGEEAVIANTLESVRKDVKQEPADEFGSVKRHELLAVAIAIILPAELDLAIINIEQATV